MRVRPILQVNPTECGLACVAMIMRAHGRGVTMKSLRDQLEVGRDGLSLQDLRSLLTSHGYEAKAFRGSVEALREATLPAICLWRDNHFVVLEKITRGRYRVVDPASGSVTLSDEEFARDYSGVVLVPTPTQDAAVLKDTEPWVWWRYLRMLKDCRSLLMGGIIVSLISYALSLVVPALTQRMIDRFSAVEPVADSMAMAWLVIGMLGATLFAISLLQVLNTVSLSVTFGRRLMTNTFGRLLRLPYRYFGSRSTGELIYRLNNVGALRDLMTSQVVRGVLDAGMVVCVFVYMMVLSPTLALVAGALFVVVTMVQFGTRGRIQDALNAEMNQLSLTQGMQIEAVSGISSLKLSAAEERFLSEWGEAYENSLVKMRRRARIQGWVSSFVSGIQTAGPLVILLLALQVATGGNLTVGGAVAFQSLSVTFFGLSGSLFRAYSDYLIASAYVDRLTDIVSAPLDSWADPGRRSGLDGSIEVRNLSFRFTGHSPDVLHNLSFTVSPGERVAIVGLSGSGKTTLGEILSGLHEPTGGSVTYSGVPIHSYDREYFYSKVGAVPQQVTLVNRSIRENICLGRELDEPERLIEAAKAAQIHHDIRRMPMGYETPISEMGANISGGQRQRIAIARALYRSPRVLILDEATSSLDAINENLITRHLSEQQCTQIIIAHRLATVQDADRILVLEEGSLVEMGTHQELVDRAGIYFQLYCSQLESTTMEEASYGN